MDAHQRAMSEFDHAVRQVRPDQWSIGTPCTEWSVRDLVNHLVNEQRWVPVLLAGATLEEVGDRFDGDLLGTDPLRVWAESSAAAREAWTEPGALDRQVHVSFGVIDATDYGWQLTTDLAVHAWDLATAIGRPIELGDDLAGALLDKAEPAVDQWQGLGIFAAPVSVARDADPQTRLVALLGRDPYGAAG